MSGGSRPGGPVAGWLAPAALFVGSFLLIAFTMSDYGLTWDEPVYLQAADKEVAWLRQFAGNLLQGRAAESLDDGVIEKAWHWDPYHVPHPPLTRVLAGLSHAAFASFLGKFLAYRLPTALFFAAMVTAMYLWMAAVFDRTTGLFAAAALVVTPNLFGHAHFAMTDLPLTALWFLTVYCFWKGLSDYRWSLALGVVWGLALATKFPAFAVPIPLLLWAHLYHRRAYHNNVVTMAFLSPLVMVGCQPYLWHQTLSRLAAFVYESTSRGIRPETNFTIYFMNDRYVSATVPRYYPFFMTAVTIPEVVLALALLGVAALWRLKPQRDVTALFFLHAAFILGMGLLPGAVLHDLTRLMLPVLPFLAGLAACGFFLALRFLRDWSRRSPAVQGVPWLQARLAGLALLLALFPPALALAVYHPHELSYYNRLVGGVRGAYLRGLEVTYLMEAYTPEFLRFLNRQLPPNAVLNASFSNFMMAYYQKENLLRRDIRLTNGPDYDYYLLLNRPSAFTMPDRSTMATRQFRVAWEFDGVPLVVMSDKARE